MPRRQPIDVQNILRWIGIIAIFAMALIALILSGILWPKQGCSSPICQACNSTCTDCNTTCLDCNSTCTDCNSTCTDCNTTCTDCNSTCDSCVQACSNQTGKIETIYTDNSTFSPNNTLGFTGVCGLETYIDSMGNITITNRRDLSPYVVGSDECSNFATPQEAYDQAVLDGRGGPGGPGAIIFIKPGNYDFGSTLFQVLQTGITFFGLQKGKVIFSATSLTGGIYVNTVLDMNNFVQFSGITFGDIGSANGFLLDITSGHTVIQNCDCFNSNFRILAGAEDGVRLNIKDSELRPLPPNDFLTGVLANTSILIENVNMFIDSGSPGGHIINMANGFNDLTIVKSNIYLNYYNGLLQGPSPNIVGPSNLFDLRFTEITQSVFSITGFDNYVILQSGNINCNLQENYIALQGFILYQSVDSVTANVHNFLAELNTFETGNSTIFNAAAVIGSFNEIDFFNNFLRVANVDEIINIPLFTAGDNIISRLIGTTISTTAGPGGTYAIGPNVGIATLYVGSSLSLEQATTTSGFTVVNLVFL
jgi:hypothetical protein